MSPLFVLILAVLATTYAGPIVRLASAPALAIAFWRLTLVLPVTGGLAVMEGRGALGVGRDTPRPTSHALWLMVLSGILLALHFWSWIASLRFTTVASSVVLVSLKPIFVWALAAVWLHEHPSRREGWGIGIAVLGAILIGIGDARLSLGALGGDALALAGALTAAGYYVIGRRVRATVGVWTYATIVYAVAAGTLLVVALARTIPLTGFAGRDWAVFGALAAGPMLLGHTGMNYALKFYRATTVNVAALGEPVGATLIAWLGLHESPPVLALIGGAIVVVGIGVTLMGRGALGVGRDSANAPRPTPYAPGGGAKGVDRAG